MRVSVVVCTYNGAAFVEEQLRTVAAQSRCPDEVIVRDDSSTDDTLARVFGVAASTPNLFRVVESERNSGVIENYHRALALAGGDIIFLADQDDLWAPNKVERMVARFDDPAVLAVASNGLVVDADGDALGYTLWDWCRFTAREQARFRAGDALAVLLRRNVVTGATMAIRKELRDLALPIPGYGMHDQWLALLGAACGTIALDPQPLVRYRLHANNQIGAARRTMAARMRAARRIDNRAHLLDQLALVRAAEARLRERGHGASALPLLDGKASHLERRLAACAKGPAMRALDVAVELARGGYHRFADPRHAVRDLLAPRS